ncbi:hypothetical protein DPMN_122739 [Dreissena polymorpha]|uniref:Uncharacterized protein n=1 Tax=Dreissena polymorpha TaxID=45954 RepID=A0A9D4JQU9_DREPO|nr:hypothetical protein DPMN_122739 [Dreissena polymorpha]
MTAARGLLDQTVRYTPGFLYLAIHELDEAHLGRFSFRSRDGIMEVGTLSSHAA